MANVPSSAGNLNPPASEPASSAWSRRLGSVIAPAGAANDELAAAGIINTQVWLDHSLWRPAAFWAFCAGLLSSGALRQADSLNLAALTVLALLVDPLWGGIWRLSGGRQALLLLQARGGEAARVHLPYLQDGSPAAKLFGGDRTDVWSSAVRVGGPVVVLAMIVAAVLGYAAVACTVGVVLLAALAWTVRRTFGYNSPLLYALASIGLPWALTVQQATKSSALVQGQVQWQMQAMLISLWVLHQWGALRAMQQRDWMGLGLLAVAQVGMAAMLIMVQAPLWLAPLALLFLPTWFLAAQDRPLRRLRIVWLAAMLISAVALGQTIGL